MTFIYRSAGCAFTGDALLIRGCGRTDFQVSTTQCCGSGFVGSICFCASRIQIYQGLRQDRLPGIHSSLLRIRIVGSICFCASRILIYQGLRQDRLPGIYSSVLRIRIRRILMFLCLPDPDPSGAAVGQTSRYLLLSVAVPDPQDPLVFGPPGSGSISQRYGSGSFCHQAKMV
jgi:hypothetical protein